MILNRYRKIAASLMVAALIAPNAANACGPFFDSPVFSCTLHPDVPFSKFAAGQLGVIMPSYARSYLVVAYRYLSNKPLDAAEQASAVGLWEARLTNEDTKLDETIDQWQKKSTSVLGKEPDRPYPMNGLSTDDAYFSYINCPQDAFANAITTFDTLSAKFGKTSPQLKDWTKAQTDVFCNCGGMEQKPKIPAAVPASSDALLKAYRDYQIAAANFYGGNYDAARKDFDAIAQDANSPFKKLASYLAVRAMVRQANVAAKENPQLMQAAKQKLTGLLSDSNLSAIKPDLDNLMAFINFKLAPDDTFKMLSQALAGGASAKLGAQFGSRLYDYTMLFDNYSDGNPKQDPLLQSTEMSDWISTLQDEKKGTVRAATQWRSRKSLPWLVAALATAAPADKDVTALLEAAEKVDKNSPAYLHARYHIARLAQGRGDKAKTDQIASAAINDASITPSARNLFVSLKQQSASTFDQFFANALQRPALIEAGSTGLEIPDNLLALDKASTYPNLAPTFAPDIANFLNNKVPLGLLSKIMAPVQNNRATSGKLKTNVAQAVFLRAALLGKKSEANALAAQVATSWPAAKAQLDSFKAASDPQESDFITTLLVLRNPGMRPSIDAGLGRETPIDKIDDYQDNWWSTPVQPSSDSPKPADFSGCLSAKEKADGASENKQLTALGPASTYLPQQALKFAKAHPGDPRVPEALHLAVRATRFGEKTAASSKLSKECFQVLHSKYPKSPWTAKTKYYY